MFARSGTPLPAEIYGLIYSHLSRADLARLLRTCRVLFKFTVPYVWYQVDMVRLLTLLPCGFVRGWGNTIKAIQVTPPWIRVPDCYFNRFHIYAQHVKHLSTSRNIEIACSSWTESTRAWVQSYSSNHTMLPRLKVASLSFDQFIVSDQGHQEVQFWAEILISDKLQALKFRAEGPRDMQYFRNLLSRCSSLVRLDFQLTYFTQFDPWSIVSEYQAPPALEHLDFECLELNHHALLWISRILGLCTLRLVFSPSHSGQPPELEDLSAPATDKYPVGAFSALKRLELKLSRCLRRWGEVVQIWQTPLVANLTQVHIIITNRENLNLINLDSSSTSHLFTLLAARSTKVHQLEIIEAVFPDLPLKLPVEVLSHLSTLPLQVLRLSCLTTRDSKYNILEIIGNLWPELEEFYSRSTIVESGHLLRVPMYLPKLRRLHIGLPLQKASADSSYSLMRDHAPPPTNPAEISPLAELTVRFHNVQSADKFLYHDKHDQDCIARTLAGLSSNVRIMPGGSRGEPMIQSIRERVSFYLQTREKA